MGGGQGIFGAVERSLSPSCPLRRGGGRKVAQGRVRRCWFVGMHIGEQQSTAASETVIQQAHSWGWVLKKLLMRTQ